MELLYSDDLVLIAETKELIVIGEGEEIEGGNGFESEC